MNSSDTITSVHCSELVINTTERFHTWILIVHVHVVYMYMCVYLNGGMGGGG